MTDVLVTRNDAQSRFEAHVDKVMAGFADYRLADGLIIFPHTVVEPRFEGQGIGSALVRGALDAVRAEGDRKVIPTCSFVASWIAKHPDYAGLLDRP